jgi:hypothetical protein
MNTLAALPAALFAAPQLLPLAPRLQPAEVHTAARFVDRFEVLRDPRLEEYSAVDDILRKRVAVEWPDKTLAWLHLDAGRTAGELLEEAYARGRQRLELLHMAAQPAAGCA